MKTNYQVAIVGSTGLVGRTVLKVLEEKNFKNCTYTLFSSKKSAGSKIVFMGQNYIIQELTESSFNFKFDFILFSINFLFSSSVFTFSIFFPTTKLPENG